MKRHYLSIMLLSATALLGACGNSGSSSNTSTDSNSTTTSTTNAATTDTGMNANKTDTTTHTTASSTPLNAADKDFVMKAANGGMMEVQGGQIAQQNASSDRVKNFGNMMVTDHSKANDELKSLVSAKGVTLPDSVKGEEKSHLDMLRKKNGKEFDRSYMEMMVADHRKDVGEFEKASKTVKDPDLKNWVDKTLPTLKTHLDSAQAINKSKM